MCVFIRRSKMWYPSLGERELAESCSQRDRKAEEELYRRYATRVYMLCRRYLGNEDEAKDTMLETLIQALDKVHSYKYAGEGSLYAWIRRIAINKALNHLKRNRWRMLPLDSWMEDNLPEPTEEEIVAVPTEKLREWIAGLPDVRRAVFNLYCIDGYSHQQIGKMLGISERGSTSTLAKARRQLKEKIRQFLDGQDI